MFDEIPQQELGPEFWCYEVCSGWEMMEVESAYSDFISSDRTGRRNAVPDIEVEGSVVGASEVTKDLAQMELKTQEGEGAAASQVPGSNLTGQQEGQDGDKPS
ncbi:cAMP-dependent protein kinase inhibitor gamma-like [Acipenser oxyrinchus oxyrinchus]|uniref:cAMP-dependent protein kinase inhibitor gamma-like n=2 Tax=Acipenser TaxID=7901 RepID=A0AAD8CH03_ACIOX|nr:cAMP-dependent protein kinase inhibitor gamma-like [Acipenser oxyrinchus oxyrinchus]KAK1146422.1 cAMP-dependent protein kinase inhibitor gamma-like [Acipenser oxyrinchus oxyrinchus]